MHLRTASFFVNFIPANSIIDTALVNVYNKIDLLCTESREKGMNKKKILTAVILIAAICALVSGGILISEILKDHKGQETLQNQTEENFGESNTSASENQEDTAPPSEQETKTATAESTEPGTEPGTESDSGQGSETQTQPEAKVNPYAEYFGRNEDMAAWLLIPGMEIDYPVMQTMRDEEYYLRKGFDGKKDTNGCLIMDTDSSLDPLGTNIIIHGHNMKSGKMFGTLMDYKDEEFYKEHKNIKLYTEDLEHNYEVVAVFYSQVYKKTDTVFKFYKFFQADTEEEFQDFYDNIKAMSLYDTGVTAKFGDKFLTLTTCSYHVDNGRFAVVAKEVEPGDSYAPAE